MKFQFNTSKIMPAMPKKHRGMCTQHNKKTKNDMILNSSDVNLLETCYLMLYML